MSEPLAYVYSRANALRRQLGDLVSDPVGSVQQTLGGLQDAHRVNQMLQGQAFSDPRQPFRVTHQNALMQLSDRMMAGPMGFAPAGITAWHGTPHQFESFDASKIGTGEGAQAYGHGLYLAEAPEVAKQYADNVKDMGFVKAVNARLSELSAQMDQHRAAEYGKFRTPEGYALKAEYDRLMGERSARLAQPGNLYKVDLPDEAVAKMLDWDAPLSKQPKEVRDYFEPLVAPIRKVEAGGSHAGWGALAAPRSYDPSGRELLTLLRGPLNNLDAATALSGGTGGAQTAATLRKQGIPGVRYLDQASRGGGGTRNFVVFPGEESALKILERNGQALP